MRFTNWLLVLPTLCLGAVIITSFVIFYAFRRGRQVIDQLQEEMPMVCLILMRSWLRIRAGRAAILQKTTSRKT